MKNILTETAIAAAIKTATETGQRVELADAAFPGLRLRISAKSRIWLLGVRDLNGNPRRYPLGEYPHMGLSPARKAAMALRAKVREGFDPIAERRRRRQETRDAREGVGTLGAVVETYGAKVAGTRRSWPESRRRIRSVFARLLDQPAASLTIGALQMAVDRWPSPQSAAAAVRYLRPILKWASAPGRRYVARELVDLTPPATVTRRDRVLSREELRAVLPCLRTLATPYHAAMLFLLLTAARREEAATATWGDIDLSAGVWRLPTTKSGRPHVVPLSRQARELLAAIRPEDVPPEALIFSTRGGKRLAGWDKATKAIMRATGTSGWTRHDLRRTAATLMGEAGIPPHVIEAALNHTAIHSQLAATYNRARYQPEVADALQRLADHLDGIAAGAAEIVSLRLRREGAQAAYG